MVPAWAAGEKRRARASGDSHASPLPLSQPVVVSFVAYLCLVHLANERYNVEPMSCQRRLSVKMVRPTLLVGLGIPQCHDSRSFCPALFQDVLSLSPATAWSAANLPTGKLVAVADTLASSGSFYVHHFLALFLKAGTCA